MRNIEKLIVTFSVILAWFGLLGWAERIGLPKVDEISTLILAVGIVGVAHIIFRIVIGIIRPSYLEAEAKIVEEEEAIEKELDDEEA